MVLARLAIIISVNKLEIHVLMEFCYVLKHEYFLHEYSIVIIRSPFFHPASIDWKNFDQK